MLIFSKIGKYYKFICKFSLNLKFSMAKINIVDSPNNLTNQHQSFFLPPYNSNLKYKKKFIK